VAEKSVLPGWDTGRLWKLTRWTLTATATCYALVLGAVLGVPDHIFATAAQYALLAAVAATGTAATVGAAVLQRSHSGTGRWAVSP
jgi:hypothetical protein